MITQEDKKNLRVLAAAFEVYSWKKLIDQGHSLSTILDRMQEDVRGKHARRRFRSAIDDLWRGKRL